MTNIDELLSQLPGEALVREGLADFVARRCTVPACLVGVARTRLSRAGLLSETAPGFIPEPERQLYGLLRGQGGDAYSRYNALLRELVSFEQALAWRQRRQKAEKLTS